MGVAEEPKPFNMGPTEEVKLTDEQRFPELFVEDKDIDRHLCKRVVPMKVLVLGMMRTGTASMRRALEVLGYKESYHMFNTFENPRDCDMWNEAYDAKFFGGKPFTKENWDQLLGHCQAVTDVPAACFGPELIAAYPDAKVILTLRDVDKWHDSVMTTVVEANKHPLLPLLCYLDPVFVGKWKPMTTKMKNGFFRGSVKDNGKQIFLDHYEEIRRLVPKENLLEYKVGEGWDRLCEFLGDETPKESFPNINETSTFHDRMALMRRKRLLFGLKPLLTGISVMVAGSYLWYAGYLAKLL
ncbi:MAG: hypothetical protein MMC33_007614 [Icmadophila ericetorum]|nr:hypothetical protein [Icmadophila ericetorum]